MRRWFVKNIIRPQWVVYNTIDGHEVGVKIFGIVIGCYKAEPYYPTEIENVRKPQKRELGETLLVPA